MAALLLAESRASEAQRLAALALTALHIVFTECLSEPVPTPTEGTAA